MPPDYERGTPYVRLMGLPWKADVEDITAFFLPDYVVTDDQVHIMQTSAGKSSGEAVVTFDGNYLYFYLK